MSKAAQLSQRLERVNVAEGMKLIEKSQEEALHFDVIEDAMCIMHDGGLTSARVTPSSIGGLRRAMAT